MERKVEIKTEYIKLEQILKFSGIFSTGGEAKNAIKSEKVFVNKQVCTERGKKIRKGDIIETGEFTLEVSQG